MMKAFTLFKKIPFYGYLLYFFCFFSLGALGFFRLEATLPTILKAILDCAVQAILISFFFILIHKNFSRKLFLLFIIPYFLISWLYLPQAIMYGSMSMGIIASLFETNLNETLEYLQNFPWYIYLIFLGYLLFFTLTLKETNKIKHQAKSYQWLLLCTTLITILTITNPLIIYTKKDHYKDKSHFYTNLLSYSKFRPINFIASTTYNIKLYLQERETLNLAFKHKPNWNIVSNRQKYQNYVLIIGESMRSDYTSLYGYPFKNTPFLEQIKGIVFENYITTAPGTQSSLNRTLYRTDIERNIISVSYHISQGIVAKIKTYWLSNQGIIGAHDTAASRLAQHTDKFFFTQKTSLHDKPFDTELLPELVKILSTPETQPRLIILHLMGSHSNFCERIPKSDLHLTKNKDMSCYLQTIKQTDNLISSINQSLRKTGEPYSVIYFSDHGLSSTPNKTSLTHGNQYKQNYHVPFIRFDSDSTERTIIHSPKSAFDFINGFAEWLGIEEKTLSQQPSFFEDKPNGKIRVFNWHEMVDFDSLEDDPPLPPTPYQ